ncbi:MAG: M14 family metallopeptidase [Candidatus Promineifilaceae bacterium]
MATQRGVLCRTLAVMIKVYWVFYALILVLWGSACTTQEPVVGWATASAEADTAIALVTIRAHAANATAIPTATTAQPTAVATIAPTATPTLPPFVRQTSIGTSTAGHPIDAWSIGYGRKIVVLIGGIHGGYEWNTVSLAYQLIDLYEARMSPVPQNITLVIIPVANPDGLATVTGKAGRFDRADVSAERVQGRFNSNQVDLNRNWDCQWQTEAVWSTRSVSGGTAPFSEAESVVLRDYLAQLDPMVAIFYHSAADGIYTGQCGEDQHPDTLSFSKIYADAAGYNLNTAFSAYAITGDASDYLNRIGVPSFTVELTTVEATEFEKNLAGVQLLLTHISQRTSR